MPDTYTPHLGLIQPEVGASRDTWGTKWNQNVSTIDNLLFMAMPIGAILDFAGPTAPSGFLICDGRLVSRVTYAKLFAVIGTYWNAGDGGTTFGLPNMNGRSGVGPGTFIDESGASYTLGFTNLQGFVTRTITQAYLPAYNLVTDSQGFHNHGSGTGPAGAHGHTTDAQGFHSHGGSSLPNHIHTGTTDLQGDHNHTYSMAAEGVGAAGGGFTIASGTTFGFPVFNTSTNGAHQHNVTTAAIGSLSLAIVGDGSHGHTISTVADHNHVIGTDGAHTHNVNLGGGGTSLKTLSPIAVVTKIIYAGQEAAIVTATDIAPAATSTDTHAEIENLREEIAALRALFETPRARMLSAPSRGPH